MHDTIYSQVLEILSVKPRHEKDLLERGFTLQQIKSQGYKSLLKTGIPANKLHSIEKTLEKQGFQLTDVPGFFLEKGRKNPDIIKPFWKLKKDSEKKYCDAIVIPVRNKFEEIEALKLRLDTTVTSRKYKYLSSKGYPKGKSHRPMVHFPLGFDENIETIRITEGEFKADYATLNSSIYTISIPGVTMWRLALSEINRMPNIKKVVLSPDSDKNKEVDPYTKKKLKKNQVNQVARSFACLAHELLVNGYEVVMEDWDESLGKGIDDVILGGNHPRTMSATELDEFILEYGKPNFPHSIETKLGFRLLPTKENAKALTDFLGVDFKYNQMKHSKEVHGDNRLEFYPDNINNAVNQLKAKASMYGMPQAPLPDLVDLVAADASYHPARDWIESQAWDGTPRIQDLFNTIHVERGWEETRDIYMKRWLISGIAALYAKNFWTKICLVLVGEGSIGKTTWFEKLFGVIATEAFKDGVILDPSDKDSRQIIISHWCVELGELSATFRKRDREELKAFITERADNFRAPYGRETVRYPRQCFFAASVDQYEFLKDEAGDIRFACLPVDAIDLDHEVNMQQVWAEVKETWFANGETWFLEKDELQLIKSANEKFRVSDPLEELLYEAYGDPEVTVQQDGARWMTARQVCEELNAAEYTKKSPDDITMKMTKALKKTYTQKDRSAKSKKAIEYLMPVMKEKAGPDLRLIQGSKEAIAKTDELLPPESI